MTGLLRFLVGVSAAAAVLPLPCDAFQEVGNEAPQVRPQYDFDKFGGVVYRSGEGFELTCDVYAPKGEGPFPGVLAVHGGAWHSGTKLHWFRHARRIAKAGFVVMAINYRHAPRYKFPAQVHDCQAAVRWLREHAEDYRVDPQRIAGFGYSAGGHLVSLLGTADERDGLQEQADSEDVPWRLQAVVAGGLPSDFHWISPESPFLTYWLGASRAQDPEIYRSASPTTYITSDDPPFFLFHGGSDVIVPVSSSETMRDQLLDANVSCELLIRDSLGHFGMFNDMDAVDQGIDFLHRVLIADSHGQ